MRDFLMKFRKDESGATLVEYGVALIVAIIVGGTGLYFKGLTEEAMLCAIARNGGDANGAGGSGGLVVVPTKFIIPSDFISFLSVASTKAKDFCSR